MTCFPGGNPSDHILIRAIYTDYSADNGVQITNYYMNKRMRIQALTNAFKNQYKYVRWNKTFNRIKRPSIHTDTV